MANSDRKEYHLCLVLSGKEINILTDSLKGIDNFTTWYSNENALLNYIFDDDYLYDFRKSKVILKTSHNNKIEIAYSASRNMLNKDFDYDSYQAFLKECIYNNALLNFLNNLMNKKIALYSKDMNIEKLEKYNKEGIYFWNEDFQDSIDEKNYNRQQRMSLLNNKKTFDETNKFILLTRILNDLLEIQSIVNHFHRENALRDDYVEQEKDKINRINLEKRIMQNLDKFNENYRNFRDLYLISGPVYETKNNISQKDNIYLSSDYVSYIENELPLIRKQIDESMKKDFDENIDIIPDDSIKSFKELEKEYSEELSSRSNNDDDDDFLAEELSKYETDIDIERKNKVRVY